MALRKVSVGFDLRAALALAVLLSSAGLSGSPWVFVVWPDEGVPGYYSTKEFSQELDGFLGCVTTRFTMSKITPISC